MADKITYYAELANRKAEQVTGSYHAWTTFLETVGRLYKYPYYEQLMIAAQRPDATACASYELWNKRMQRYVKRGSRGIALIDTSREEPALKYVFDIADTGARENSRRPYIWQYREEHELPVISTLSKQYQPENEETLSDLIEGITKDLIEDYWDGQQQDILGIVDGSFLEGYDEENIRFAFCEAATVSATYAILARCGLDPDSRYEHEDFMPVFDFNTPQAVSALGTAISQTSEQILRQIEITIKTVERQRMAERRIEHEQTDLQQERRLSDPQPPAPEYPQETPGQIRQNAEELPAEPSSSPLEQHDPVGDPVPPSAGNRRDSEPSSGADDAEADETERRDRDTEGQRSDEMGRVDEQSQDPGRGNDFGRADLQLTFLSEQLALFPSEPEQISIITQNPESNPSTLFGFCASQNEIDHILRLAGGQHANRMRIAAQFIMQKPLTEVASLLPMYYRGGNGITTENRSLSAWFDADGMHLALGTTSRYLPSAQTIAWIDIANRIQELLDAGQFATSVEVEEAPSFVRTETAQMLWHLHGDLTEDAKKQGYLSSLSIRHNNAPIETAYISDILTDPEQRSVILEEYETFFEAYQQDRSLLRFQFHNVKELLHRLDELELPQRQLSSKLNTIPEITQFITEDEVNDHLTRGSVVAGSKGRIYDYFSQEHTSAEQASFLKKEYGLSGSSPIFHGADGSDVWCEGKGMRFRKAGCPEVTLSWSNVAKRINKLFLQDRFLTDQEKEQLQAIQDAKKEPTPVIQRELTQDDIDCAIQEWNGNITSKHAVVRYMTEHGRERDTAEWLKAEYGDDLPAFPVTANGAASDLSWTKVQRRIAQLIRDHRFYTREEYDRLDDVDPIAIRIALEQRGIVDGEIEDPDALDADPFIQQVMADAERNANTEDTGHLSTKPVAYYNADQTGLPYDISIQTLQVEEPVSPVVSIPIKGEWTGFPDITSAEVAAHEEHKDRIYRNAQNFIITDDDWGAGGPKTKFQANFNAIKLLKYLEADGSQALPEQQEVLSRYVGWGGLADAFDPSKEKWAAEHQALKELLTPEEYAAARASTLNAHYTTPTVIKAIYAAVEKLGFHTGNVLEPSMGIGNFFGCLPEAMQNSRLYGIELDDITGRIARQLYPKANITIAGFETTDKKDFFDLAIGNVPFGQYQVNDRAYNKLGFSIHDYFFAKALDQVRPGGVVAFITSRYTMDKQSPEVRSYIAQRADLLGAIRLPNNAFKSAGTDVVSDILFLQKRDSPIIVEPDWVHLGTNTDGYSINSYFINHPEMVLGQQTEESTQYGRMDYTVAPFQNAHLADQLQEAIQHIHGTYQEAELPDLGEGEDISSTILADPNVKNYSYAIVDGEVYYRENSVMVKPDLNATAIARIKGLVDLRDCVHRLIDLQMWESDPIDIRNEQLHLNQLYDHFTDKYGLINDRGNRLAFSDDSSYYLLCSLEILDDNGKLERKADLFTKRTIKQAQVVTSVDTASEALAVSIAEKAGVDMSYMAQLTGMSEEDLADDLRGVVFRLPGSADENGTYHFATADEYLSGNVRKKLEQAKQAATNEPELFAGNVEALEAAQLKDLDASEIDVRLGATWIDKHYIQEFMEDLLDPPFYLRRHIQVNYSPYSAEWNITGKTQIGYSDVNANVTYGTDRANAYKILEETLNLRDIRIYDTVVDPGGNERRILNQKATTLAAQKQDAIKEAFRDWIWKDPVRRQILVEKYNTEFNSVRPREYNGDHITFSGMTPEITLRDHQKNAIAHILYGGNTLLAHEVGAGKTFEMVAAAMESKRLGLCQKSLFAVPNHLTEQWAAEFLRLYPSANILVTTKKDFEKHNRKKFCSRIATGDYDAIIMGHSQFERIPVSLERQEKMINEQLDEIEAGIDELKRSGAEKFTVKSLEKTKKGLETKLQKLLSSDRKDDVVTFEQLGVDRLFVDEAHSYKNLYLYTKMRNVAGLAASDAQKSSDMLMKCRYLDEITDSKGVVFATGTPVSNSMTELYTMMRYLQHDMLKEHGWAHFDCWASQFGETKTAIELAPEGTGYRARTRFAKFYNLPELITLWKEAADIKTADQMHLPRPKAIYHNEVAKPTEDQKLLVQELSKRAALVHAGSVDASEDNMLKITSDGRKLGLDQRLINDALPDDENSKVNMCVNNIVQIWKDGEADKLTQLVFCDISTPKTTSSSAKEKSEDDNSVLNMTHFTVYDDIRKKLIDKGIPPEQIAFIHDANTEVRKKELFAKVRTGQVRVLMGSTFKMGAGMNVQDRLIALHDLDCPWRPGDLEQRSGRIIRQGNMNPEVHIYRYVTEGTFDSYLWQTVENKQKFISQIMTSKSPVRSCEDVDETALSYAEIKALCAGDPRIKEKMDLDIDVARLKLLKADHQSQQFRLEDNLLKHFPEQLEQAKNYIAGFEADMKTLSEHPHPEDGFAGMIIRGDTLTDKDNAGAALLEACKEVTSMIATEIGTYRGFNMTLSLENFGKDHVLTLKGKMSHRVILGNDARGNLTRIENTLGQIVMRRAAAEAERKNIQAQMDNARSELGKPFPQEAELKAKSARLAELNAVLNIDDKSHSDQREPDSIVAKRERPSVLHSLKTQTLHGPVKKRIHEREER